MQKILNLVPFETDPDDLHVEFSEMIQFQHPAIITVPGNPGSVSQTFKLHIDRFK